MAQAPGTRVFVGMSPPMFDRMGARSWALGSPGTECLWFPLGKNSPLDGVVTPHRRTASPEVELHEGPLQDLGAISGSRHSDR